jgi:hypothetical protein
MAKKTLEVRGTIALSQFWPAGDSDADTAKVIVKVGGNAFKFGGKITHAFDNAEVKRSLKSQSGTPAIKKGKVTIRLQEIDCAELHFRPTFEGLTEVRW